MVSNVSRLYSRLLVAATASALGGSVVAGAVVALPGAARAAPTQAVILMGTVHTAGGLLNVRGGPSTGYPVVRQVRFGSPLAVTCQVSGQLIVGVARTTGVWDRLTDGRYVSDAFVAWPHGRPAIPWCALLARVRTLGGVLNLRSNASTLLPEVGRLPQNSGLTVVCQLGGEGVAGPVRTSSLWDRLANGRYVTDAYVAWPGARPGVPWCTLTAGAVPTAGEPFVAWAAAYARQSQAADRVPASVTIAQAILESGWGRSGLTRDGNSFFGMKCFGTPGPIAAGCRSYRTTECGDNRCYSTSAAFRVYPSAAASFLDHGRQLATLPRYRPAFAFVNDPNRFAIEIHKAGYATGPHYAQSLINLMRQYNLYRFNR